MEICIVTKDALLARFLTLELAEIGFAAEACEAFAESARLYLCDLDSFTGEIPENTIGFSYDDNKQHRIRRFLHRPIDSAALHKAVAEYMSPTADIGHAHTLTVDRATRRVKTGLGEVRLSEKELILLEKLCAVSLLTRETAAGIFGDGDSNVVDVYMHYLRKKLKNVCPYDVIASKRREGYALTGKVTIHLS